VLRGSEAKSSEVQAGAALICPEGEALRDSLSSTESTFFPLALANLDFNLA
jgi:hypothetical protein